MRQTAGDSLHSKIPVQDLREYLEDWNFESRLRQHTAQSFRSRQARISKFFWFLQHRDIKAVGLEELKSFFNYLINEGHLEPMGRWGNPKMTTPMRAVSVCGYHRILKAFFNFLVNEDIISSNPMARIKPPSAKTEIKQPVLPEHIQLLLLAAKNSAYNRRDMAIVLLLLDTGLRASELCNLRICDIDFKTQSIRVLGKGNKYRTCYMGFASTKALAAYLRGKKRQQESSIFLSHTTRKTFTASGIYQLVSRLSETAGIPCPGVHAFRRTFAVDMLRSGANVFTVQILLGHSDLAMTRRYCKIADADTAEQHRKFSPADKLST